MTQGVATIDFCASGMGTRLAHLYQSDPLRVMFPHVPAGEPLQAALITTSGGMVGGDTHSVQVAAGRNASAMVVGQAAEKVYRSNGPDCTIDIDLNVEDAAWLEWLPQETIMFDGARLRRRTHADVAPGGRLLAGEVVVFGRTAMGETVRSGLFHDEWEVSRGGRPVWADAQHWTDPFLRRTKLQRDRVPGNAGVCRRWAGHIVGRPRPSRPRRSRRATGRRDPHRRHPIGALAWHGSRGAAPTLWCRMGRIPPPDRRLGRHAAASMACLEK